MADFFTRRDVSAVTSFSDPGSLIEFNFEAREQLVFNESDAVLEVSFDGVNTHARLNATGPSAVIHWSDHVRRKVWIRKVGAGSGSKMVQVLATTS